MKETPNIARVAQLMADPARAQMLWTLMDGTMRPAGELALAANVSAQSASAHLAKLVAGGLLKQQPQGRHRYFRIAGPEIAALVEAMAALDTSTRPAEPRSLPAPGSEQFRHARTCYGHLAGETAVKMLDGMVESRWLVSEESDYRVTRRGEESFAGLGIDLAAARRPRRAFARACVDLTQRRPHLGGSLGDALLDLFVGRGWVLRSRRSRAVSITPKGQENLRQWFGMS